MRRGGGEGGRGKLADCLRWSLKWADHLEWLEAEAEADLTFQPKALAERPELWEYLAFYAQAFHDLSSARPLGALGGAGPIPWTALDAYATRHNLDDPDAFATLKRYVDAQDRVYLKDAAEKMKGGK